MSSFPPSDAVFQFLSIRLRTWAANPAFEPANLVQIRLILDRSESGGVLLDDIGFRD